MPQVVNSAMKEMAKQLRVEMPSIFLADDFLKDLKISTSPLVRVRWKQRRRKAYQSWPLCQKHWSRFKKKETFKDGEQHKIQQEYG